jgi:hypothetical protein
MNPFSEASSSCFIPSPNVSGVELALGNGMGEALAAMAAVGGIVGITSAVGIGDAGVGAGTGDCRPHWQSKEAAQLKTTEVTPIRTLDRMP